MDDADATVTGVAGHDPPCLEATGEQMMHRPAVLHVTSPAEWAATLCAGGLQEVPFLHLCTQEQLDFVLEKHFAGREGLLLVTIDPAGLDIRWEASESGMAPFPHLYGWAPVSAVVSVADLSGTLGDLRAHPG